MYTGTTKNPRARRAAHKSDGKNFKYMQVETEPMGRKSAEQWETRSLKGYRSRVGKNPKYNKLTTVGITIPVNQVMRKRDASQI